MISNIDKTDGFAVLLTNQIKASFERNHCELRKLPKEKILMNLQFLEDFIDSQANSSKEQFAYEDISFLLNEIIDSLENLPENNYHEIGFFRVLVNLYLIMPNDKINIKFQILFVIEFLINNFPNATDDFIEYDINTFIAPIIIESNNTALRTKSLYIVKNLITSNSEDRINQYFIENGYIEMISHLYESILSQPDFNISNDLNNELNSLMIPIISILINFILFHELIPAEIYSLLFETITDIITRRYQSYLFATQVEDIISNAMNIIYEIDLSIFFETGFILQVYDILNEENLVSSYASPSFFFLGALLKALVDEESQMATEIASNINLSDICTQIMDENDNSLEYYEGFFFYLTNLLSVQENSIIELLNRINFFAWCISISGDLYFNAQKSLCYFLLSTLYFADDTMLSELISINDLVDFLFEVLTVAKKKLTFHALSCFVRIFNTLSHFSTKFDYFFDQVSIYLDKSKNFEDNSEINELFGVLQKNVDSNIIDQ